MDDKKKSKFGRKPLPDDERREIRIDIWLNTGELKELQTRFEGKNFRGKLRDFLLHSEKRTFTDDDTASVTDSKVVFELRKIGVNLNQIAFKINVGDYPATEDLQLHLTQLQNIIKKQLLG